MFSGYSRRELEMNNQFESNSNNILLKDLNIWKLNNILLNDQWIKEESEDML